MSKTRTASETHRAVADFLDAHPGIPVPYTAVYDHQPDVADLSWYMHINGKGDETVQREAAQAIVRGVGGKWDKEFSDNEARFAQRRDGLNMLVVVVREAVCERRVVGSETVVVPAIEAEPERTVVREIVEWDCSPVLTEVSA